MARGPSVSPNFFCSLKIQQFTPKCILKQFVLTRYEHFDIQLFLVILFGLQVALREAYEPKYLRHGDF